MTQPAQMQIQAAAHPVACPDGKHRVGVQIIDGPLTFGLMIDADSVPEFAAGLSAAMLDAARVCKLANGGLVVAAPGPLPVDLTMPVNGGRP